MDKPPSILKCPFRNTLITRDYGCEYSQEVTHRDGPGIVCGDRQAYQRCIDIYTALKDAALPVMGQPDDPNLMPASVISKIQYGGLQSLSEMLGQKADRIENINAMMEALIEKFSGVAAIDLQKTAEVIQNYQLRKRRR